jgi:hypothetical protein
VEDAPGQKEQTKVEEECEQEAGDVGDVGDVEEGVHEDVGRHKMDGMGMDTGIHEGIHEVRAVVDQACNDQGDEEVVGGYPISRVPIVDNGKEDSVCEESWRENAMAWVKA